MKREPIIRLKPESWGCLKTIVEGASWGKDPKNERNNNLGIIFTLI